jgi:polysaccharide deacetylase family protein (PEP-CTERM system associated)
MDAEVVETDVLEPIVNAMTVDVEDYFHVSVFDGLIPRHEWATMESRVVANTERLLEMFDEEGITATFFVLGWVAERFPRLVRDIAAHGHEIASHGFEHRLVYDMTPAAFRDDIRRSKALLESAAAAPVLVSRAQLFGDVAIALGASTS